MNEAIQTAINKIEHDHDVRVLYAAESGSRAWGFASPDSDYDVRLVYAHPRDWYLQIFEQRDVIEYMLPGDLDISGWDLRKSLRLLAKCNLAFNEWFDSPMVYRSHEAFATRIRELIHTFFQPTRALFHYLNIASATYTEHLQGDTVRLKKLFYFLRPILACRWIEHTRRQPPTRFSQLLTSTWVSDEERAWIAELETRKATTLESDYCPLPDFIRPWMRTQLEHYTRIGPTLAQKSIGDFALLDRVLRDWVSPS